MDADERGAALRQDEHDYPVYPVILPKSPFIRNLPLPGGERKRLPTLRTVIRVHLRSSAVRPPNPSLRLCLSSSQATVGAALPVRALPLKCSRTHPSGIH